MQQTKKRMNIRKLTTLAMLAALSVGLTWLVHFPIFPTAPFLEYDPAHLPILIGTFAYGPLAGLALTAVTAIIQGLTVSASSGPYGILMHIIAAGSYVLVAGFIYKFNKSRVGAAIGLAAGAMVSTVLMCFANLLITPIFMNAQIEAVQAMMFTTILPFNLIKSAVNGLLVFLIYKPISNVIHKANAA